MINFIINSKSYFDFYIHICYPWSENRFGKFYYDFKLITLLKLHLAKQNKKSTIEKFVFLLKIFII